MCLESILQYFQVQACFGAMWRLQSLLELMDEETRRCSRNPKSESRFRRSVDRHLFLGVSRHPCKQMDILTSRPTQAHKSHILKNWPWSTLYLVFIVFAIVQARYHMLQKTILFRSFQVEENIQENFRDLYWNTIISYSIYLCNSFSLSLCLA